MGSYEMAYITGFLCRLCSEMHRTIIHIYGDQGRRQQIAKKINDYLPVTVSPSDPLPKTICKTCLQRVEQHHELIQTMQRSHAFANKAMAAHRAAQKARLLSASGSGSTTDTDAVSVGVAAASQTEAEEAAAQADAEAETVERVMAAVMAGNEMPLVPRRRSSMSSRRE